MKPTAVLGALLLVAVPLGAHEGHGEISILTGTVRSVANDRLEIETFDDTLLQRKNVWMLLDDKTRLLVGKHQVKTIELVFGHRVETAVRSEHARDGSTQWRALQVRLNEPKKPAPSPR